MNRRSFLKSMLASAVAVTVPLHLCSMPFNMCDDFVERYMVIFNLLTEQKTSRLRAL